MGSVSNKFDIEPSAGSTRHIKPHLRSPHFRVVRGQRIPVRPAIVNGAAAWSRREALNLALARAQSSFVQRHEDEGGQHHQHAAMLDLVDLAAIKEKLMESAEKVIRCGIEGYHRLEGEECAALAIARVRVVISRVAGDPPSQLQAVIEDLMDLEDDLLAASLFRLNDAVFQAVGERLEESTEVANLRFRLAYLRAMEARARA